MKYIQRITTATKVIHNNIVQFFFQQPETSRQADSGLLTTLISLGLRYGPTLFNLVMGGDEGGSATSDKVSTDKIDNLDNQKVLFF